MQISICRCASCLFMYEHVCRYHKVSSPEYILAVSSYQHANSVRGEKIHYINNKSKITYIVSLCPCMHALQVPDLKYNNWGETNQYWNVFVFNQWGGTLWLFNALNALMVQYITTYWYTWSSFHRSDLQWWCREILHMWLHLIGLWFANGRVFDSCTSVPSNFEMRWRLYRHVLTELWCFCIVSLIWSWS